MEKGRGPSCAGMASRREDAAVFIQYWWRKAIRLKEGRLVHKAEHILERRLLNVRLSENEQLLAQLELLRKAKMTERNRYERLVGIPARDVNDFLRAELAQTPEETVDDVLQREEASRVDAAARLRENAERQRARRFLREVKNVRPAERVRLVEELSQRLTQRTPSTVADLSHIKNLLAAHKRQEQDNAFLFAGRSKRIKDFQTSIHSLQGIPEPISSQSLRSLQTSSSLAHTEALLFHNKQLEEIEAKLFGINTYTIPLV